MVLIFTSDAETIFKIVIRDLLPDNDSSKIYILHIYYRFEKQQFLDIDVFQSQKAKVKNNTSVIIYNSQ